ncbi:unnamed protein product [Ilex paraguariensis]|uniref:Uncharacterized protein n=1 Tax=Ilex paraguariensis TaxID=185542 RepID=A0ABC8S2I9_9AQUA
MDPSAHAGRQTRGQECEQNVRRWGAQENNDEIKLKSRSEGCEEPLAPIVDKINGQPKAAVRSFIQLDKLNKCVLVEKCLFRLNSTMNIIHGSTET